MALNNEGSCCDGEAHNVDNFYLTKKLFRNGSNRYEMLFGCVKVTVTVLCTI